MENVFIAIFCIALLLFGALTISEASLNSTDEIASAWRQMEETSGEISRTNISSVGAVVTSANSFEVTLKNEGETKLQNFEDWDVIVQYFDNAQGNLLVKWLPYTEAGNPGNNEWTVGGIYLDAATSDPEVFEKGIFNPGEEMVIDVKLVSVIDQEVANLVTISTPNGVSASEFFIRP